MIILVIKDEKNKFCYKYEVPDRYEFILKTLVTEDLDHGDNFYISIDNADNDGIKIHQGFGHSRRRLEMIKRKP